MHYHFEGELMARDGKHYLPFPFAVPSGWGGIELRLHFAPAAVHGFENMLTLTLFDPAGFRGAGHRGGDTHRVRIGPADATPGYLPGPLPAGEWLAEVDTHMIMPGEPLRFWLDIDLLVDDPAASAPSTPRPPDPSLRPRQPGWYRGDLHSHTHHSDAGERSVAELAAAARAARLDFLFVTDHNTTSHLAEIDAESDKDLLVAGGLELTTFWGHALCLGGREWVDWRVQPASDAMAAIALDIYAKKQLFVIAHPQSLGDPACTGCRWRFGNMMPGTAQCVEVWNGPWKGDSNNEEALSLWYDWLNQGLRLTATAGTDTHSAGDYAARPGFSVVYSEALTEADLLQAVRAGHLYLSAGPKLELEARSADGRRALMGDTLSGPASVRLTWSDAPDGARLCIVENGRLLRQWTAASDGAYGWELAPQECSWLVVEMRSAEGELLAITNPLYWS